MEKHVCSFVEFVNENLFMETELDEAVSLLNESESNT